MARFVGKVLGGVLGLAMSGGFGGALGFLLGHLHDIRTDPAPKRAGAAKEREQPDFLDHYRLTRHQRSIYSLGVIILGAKLAKVDGPVTREEILAFRHAFHTTEAQLDEVGHIFNHARSSADGYEPHAARLAQVFANQPALLEEILVGLFVIAQADSAHLTRAELLFLRRVAVLFGLAEEDFTRLAARAGVYLNSAPPAPKQDSAYDVLGLPTTATNDVVKRTYRALVRKHHPDKLAAAGLPASRVAEATERLKRINAAYDEICKKRGIK